MNRADMVYRKTAVEGASGFGLLIALYDTLAGNIRRAAEAQRTSDIERRSREVKHAVTVIGYLESCLRRGVEGDLTQQLRAFYSTLRRKLLQAQVKQSAEMLEQQMAAVLKIRGAWQAADLGTTPSTPQRMLPVAQKGTPGYASPRMQNMARY